MQPSRTDWQLKWRRRRRWRWRWRCARQWRAPGRCAGRVVVIGHDLRLGRAMVLAPSTIAPVRGRFRAWPARPSNGQCADGSAQVDVDQLRDGCGQIPVLFQDQHDRFAVGPAQLASLVVKTQLPFLEGAQLHRARSHGHETQHFGGPVFKPQPLVGF